MELNINTTKPGRDGIWQIIRHKRIFTINDLMSCSHMDHSSIRTYLSALINGKYIQKKKRPKGSPLCTCHEFELINDVGINAPELNADGTPKKLTKNQKIWLSIKVLKRFDYRDVSFATQVEKNYTRKYLQALRNAEYLKVISEATYEHPEKYWFLPANDTGRKAPQIKRDKSVYDPNIDKVVFDPKNCEVAS